MELTQGVPCLLLARVFQAPLACTSLSDAGEGKEDFCLVVIIRKSIHYEVKIYWIIH